MKFSRIQRKGLSHDTDQNQQRRRIPRALQGFAHGPACIDLSPEGEGFTLFVPVFRADSLPEVWQAISAYDASKGEETMPGLIDLYAAHDASKAD